MDLQRWSRPPFPKADMIARDFSSHTPHMDHRRTVGTAPNVRDIAVRSPLLSYDIYFASDEKNSTHPNPMHTIIPQFYEQIVFITAVNFV